FLRRKAYPSKARVELESAPERDELNRIFRALRTAGAIKTKQWKFPAIALLLLAGVQHLLGVEHDFSSARRSRESELRLLAHSKYMPKEDALSGNRGINRNGRYQILRGIFLRDGTGYSRRIAFVGKLQSVQFVLRHSTPAHPTSIKPGQRFLSFIPKRTRKL